MAKPRVIETNQGIQGELNVAVYDQMQRTFRDRGWIETGEIIKHGITRGHALEVGPGPGYLGSAPVPDQRGCSASFASPHAHVHRKRALIGHLGHQERSEFGVDVTCMLYSSLAMQRTNGPQKTAASRQWPYHLKPDGIW